MTVINPGPRDASLEEVLESLELSLEAIDALRAQLDRVDDTATAAAAAARSVDGRPDRLLVEVERLHRKVEEIAEATWRRADDDRLQGALDAIERLRIRIDDANPSDSVRRTLDLVSHVASRLDDADGQALAELTLEAIEDLRRETIEGDGSTRAALDRAAAELARVRDDIDAHDPAEAIELALEAMDDVGARVDERGDAIERRLDTIETTLTGLTELAGTLAGAVAELAATPSHRLPPPPPIPAAIAPDDAAIAAIADRVAGALMGRVDLAIGVSTDRIVGRVDAATDRMLGRLESAPALPSGDQHAAVVASAAAAMSRLEGRLDTEFGSVERSVERLDRHLVELEGLVRGTPTDAGEEAAAGNGSRPPNGDGAGRPAEGATADVAARVRASANGLLATLRTRATTSTKPTSKIRGRAARR